MLTKEYSKFVTGGLFLLVALLIFQPHLLAQNYFPLGIFNYDVTGPEHRLSQANETDLIINLNANYLSEMSQRAQNDLIIFSDTLSTRVFRTDVIYDSVCWNTNNYYPLMNPVQVLNNDRLDRYISDNEYATDIHYADIRRFVHNVDSIYGSHSGVGMIRVAHQNFMDRADHWPFIRRAGYLIQQHFGNAVKSVAINNFFQWGYTRMQDFFSNDPLVGGVGDSLDVYQHEYYPFFDYTNPAGAPYNGDAFQDLIDDRYIASCESTRMHLKRSGNIHTTLEMIIQSDRNYLGTAYFRRPTQAEIWLQAFLALGRGYKGIHVHCYRTAPPGSYPGQPAWYDSGLVDTAVPRQPINIPSNNQPYNNVAPLFDHLAELGDDLLPLTVLDAYTWNGTTRHKYIKTIANDSLEGNHRTIEVSLMDDPDPANTYDYFLLINRRCNRDNAGVWVNAFPQNIDVTLADSMPTGTYQIRDLYSNEYYVTSDKVFRQIKILAGRGRVFELKRLFVNAIDILSDTVNICSSITVPSGKTLSISPNSTIKFYNSTELKVQGTLTGNGTSAQHIVFGSAATNPTKGIWKQIKFENSQNTSTLDYCDISYGEAGVWCQGSSHVTLKHLTVNNSKYWGLYLLNDTTFTTVENSSFTNNNDKGVFLYHSSPDLINVTCTNNKYGLFCYNKSEPKIGYSHFSNNSSDGIYCSSNCKLWMYYHATYFPNRGWNWIQFNTGRGVAAYSSSFPYLGLNASYAGNNIIEQNGDYEICNGNSNGWIWAVYNWWQYRDGPNRNDLYTDATVEIDPVNPNPKPETGRLAGLSNSTLDEFLFSDSLMTPQSYNYLGTQYLIEGEYTKAIEAFQYVISNYPSTEEATYALAHIASCFEKVGKKNEIIPYLEAVAKANPGSKLEGFSLSLSVPYLEETMRFAEAVERCQKVQDFYQDKEVTKNLLFIMSNIYFYGLKENEKAKANFEEFIKNYPDDPLASTAQAMLEIMDSRSLPKPQISANESVNNSPTDFTLSQNYPNPFNPETTIRYQLPEAVPVKLVIYNLRGQQIRKLLDERKAAGDHLVRWDGTDDANSNVASGIYVYRLSAGNFQAVKKMALIR